MTTTTYTEVATADGAWACPVLLPSTDFGLVRNVLMDLATSTGVPVAALAYGDTEEPGLHPGAVEHAPSEVDALLAQQDHAIRWQTATVRIVSARYIDRTTTHWYDEVGVLVHADNDLLPAINRVAVAIGQRRFVVTDVTAGRTRAFAQSD
ncbi:hypothetical protein GCM10029964_092750 [Kibdelosporangium lantanae]